MHHLSLWRHHPLPSPPNEFLNHLLEVGLAASMVVDEVVVVVAILSQMHLPAQLVIQIVMLQMTLSYAKFAIKQTTRPWTVSTILICLIKVGNHH